MFILPFMEASPLFNSYNQMGRYLLPDKTKNPDGNLRYGGLQHHPHRPRFNTFTCPSDTPTKIGNVTEHNYVVNFGNAGFFQELQTSSSGTAYATPYYAGGAWLGRRSPTATLRFIRRANGPTVSRPSPTARATP